MSIIPKENEQHCFIACTEDKIKQGNCHCINRINKELTNNNK